MIKEKTVVIPAQESREVKKEVYVCDICGREGENRKNYVHCSLCGRLVCHWYYGQGVWNHRYNCSNYDPHEIGDYPAEFCSICYDLVFDKYEKERNEIDNEHDLKIEALDNRIKEESLSVKPAQKEIK